MLNEKINILVYEVQKLHFNDPSGEKYMIQIRDLLCTDLQESIVFFDTCDDIDVLEWTSTFIDDLAYEFPTVEMIDCLLRLGHKNSIQENHCSILIKIDVESAVKIIERIING